MIDEANEILRAKGYSQAHLAPSRRRCRASVLLKGTKILSPFSDTPGDRPARRRDCVRRPRSSAGAR